MITSKLKISFLVIFLFSILFYFYQVFVKKLPGIEFGDAGLKFLQTTHFLESGNLDFSFIYKGSDIDPEKRFFPYTLPYVANHNGKENLVFSPYFAWINSYFFQWFGNRGLYILSFLALILNLYFLYQILNLLNINDFLKIMIFFLYSFGTSIPIYNLYYHEYPIAICLSTIGLYYFLKAQRFPEITKNFILFGLFFGLSLFFRLEIAFLFSALVLGHFLFTKERRYSGVVFSTVGYTAPLILFLGLNWYIHGHILGLDFAVHTDAMKPNAGRRLTIIYQTLFDPIRGLFVQSPYTILFFLALPFIIQLKEKLGLILILGVYIETFAVFLQAPNNGEHFAPRYLFSIYTPGLIAIGILYKEIERKSIFLMRAFWILLIMLGLISFYFWRYNLNWTNHMQKEVNQTVHSMEKNTGKYIVFYNYLFPLNVQNLDEKKVIFVAGSEEKIKILSDSLFAKGINEFHLIYANLDSHPSIEDFTKLFSVEKVYEEKIFTILLFKKK